MTTVSDRIGAGVRTTRTRHDWTRDDLAGRLAALGAPHLTASVLYDIESGRPDAAGRRRREVSADEWIVLAVALDCAPVHLAIPLEDDEPCQLSPAVTEPAGLARQWFRGHHPLALTDRRMFYAYVPESELERAEQLAKLQAVSPELFKRIIGESEDQ